MGGAQLEYLHAAPRIAKLLSQFGLASLVRPLEYNLGELRTPDGLGLYIALQAEIMAELPQRIDAIIQVSSLRPNQMGFDPKRMRLYLIKAAAEAVTPAVKLAHLAGVLAIGWREQPHLLICRDADAFIVGWPCVRALLVQSYSSHPHKYPGRWFAVARHIVRPVFDACVWHARGITSSVPAPLKPQIGVELLDANDPADLTFYPWYRDSGIAAD